MELKKEQPSRSDETINQFLQAQFGQPIPRSTLYRHLKQAERYQRELGAHGDAAPLPAPGKRQHNYLDLLVKQHEQSREKTIPAIAFQLQRLSDQEEIANL